MEYEIEIDLGDIGGQIALVSALVDSDGAVTLTEVNVVIAGNKINVVSMLDDSAKIYIEMDYIFKSGSDTINGKHLYDEHDYS